MARLPAAAAILAAALAITPAATAAPKPCPAGKATVRIAGQQTCRAASAALLPRGSGASSIQVALMKAALSGQAALPLQRATEQPPRLRKASPRLAFVRGAVPRLEGLARRVTLLDDTAPPAAAPGLPRSGGRALLGAGYTTGSVSVNATATSVSQSVSATGSHNGVTATVTTTSTAPVTDGALQPQDSTLSMTLTARGSSFALSASMQDHVQFEQGCPTAEGIVDARERANVQQSRTEQYVDGTYRETVTLTSSGTWRGTVEPDAKLSRLTFDTTVRVTMSTSGSGLFGLLPFSSNVAIVVVAAGEVNMRSGAISYRQLFVTGAGSASGVGSADIRSALAEPGTRETYLRLARDLVDSGVERSRVAEAGWQTPDQCAKARLDPRSSERLASGSTTSITGRVEANRGGESEARWEAPTMERGELVRGLPGESASGSPIALEVRGGQPDAQRRTAVLRARVTSRAGVARAEWTGRSPAGYRLTLSGQATSAIALPPGASATVSVPISGSVEVRPEDVAGQSVLHGTAALTYGGASIVAEGICGYAPGAASGNVDVQAATQADDTVAFTFIFSDALQGHLTGSPMGCGAGEVATGLASVAGILSGPPRVTVPATGGDGTISWNIVFPPLQASGSLAVHAEPLVDGS